MLSQGTHTAKLKKKHHTDFYKKEKGRVIFFYYYYFCLTHYCHFGDFFSNF